MKIGVQGGYLVDNRKNFTNDQNLTFRVNNGVPNQITQTALPFQVRQRVRYDAVYAQEQWTRGRMTLQGALRFDRASSWFPEQPFGPSNWVPFSTTFERQEGVDSYLTLSPRAGLAYDVMGDGKTSLKVNIGQYLEAASNGNGNYSIGNPTARIATTVARSWIDANGDFVPDYDLVDGAAQDLRASGGDFCGAISNQSFGQPVFSNTIDPGILSGWGERPTDWQIGVSIQREVLPRVSVEVGYFRRWLQNFTVTDNRAVTAADFTGFSLVAPLDPRLPGGGDFTVSELYNVNPDKFGQTDNFVTRADNFGSQKQVYNGLLITASARPGRGLSFQGGINTGKTTQDNCAVRAVLPELVTAGGVNPVVSPTNPFCRNSPGFVTRVTGLGTYLVPRVDVMVAGTFRSDQGAPLRAIWNAPNAVVEPVLGRPLAGNAPNVAVDLIAPGDVWGDRVNELDLRFAKVLRFGRIRTHGGVDIFNILNANAVLTYSHR